MYARIIIHHSIKCDLQFSSKLLRQEPICQFVGEENHQLLEMKAGFPLGLEKLENLEKWEGIFQSGKSQGILNRLEKSGKITQNTGKLREFQINIIWYFYKLFLVIFKWTVYCLLKWIKFSVKKTKD